MYYQFTDPKMAAATEQASLWPPESPFKITHHYGLGCHENAHT